MNITPATDLAHLIGAPIAAHYRNHNGDHVVNGTIHELHHGATSTRPEFLLGDGVRGRMSLACGGSTWFYWPYDGLTIEVDPP